MKRCINYKYMMFNRTVFS